MATFTKQASAVLGASKTGLTGTLRYTVKDTSGSVLVATTTSGISESGTSGIYSVAIASFDVSWSGRIEWDTVAAGLLAVDDFAPVPAVDSSGRTTVGSIANNAVTAAAIADGAIDAATFADDAITARSIATDAIGSAELAAAGVSKIQSGLMLASSYTAPDNADIVTGLADLVLLLARNTPLDAVGVRAALGLASANLDTQLAEANADLDEIITSLAAIQTITLPLATVTGTPTSTSVQVTGLTETTANAYRDGYFLLQTGTHQFTVPSPISASSYSGGTTTLTFATALVVVPSAGDAALIIGSKRSS